MFTIISGPSESLIYRACQVTLGEKRSGVVGQLGLRRAAPDLMAPSAPQIGASIHGPNGAKQGPPLGSAIMAPIAGRHALKARDKSDVEAHRFVRP